MNRKNVRIVLLILFVSVGLTVGLLKLDALMDDACRGTDWCADCEYVCYEGDETINSWKVGSVCDGPGWCKSYIRVMCLDEETMQVYYGYCLCYTPAGPEECGSQL